jgi:hypothetical protein
MNSAFYLRQHHLHWALNILNISISTSRNLQRSKSRALEVESMANYGFIYDEVTGAYVCSEESKTSSGPDNHSEALPVEAVFQPRESKLPGPDRDRDRGSHLGVDASYSNSHAHSEAVRSESKNGREEVGRDKGSNNDAKMWLSSSARAKDSPITRRRDEAGDLRQLEESATPSRVQVPSSHYNKGKVVATPSKIPVASGHAPHTAVNSSEAKTPLSKHAGYSSSGNGGPSGLPVCVPPSPPAQSVLQAPLVIGDNNSNSSSRGKNANHAKGANIAQTPLSPGPLPSNMNKQQRGYAEYLNDDADSNPNSINKQKQLDSKASRFPIDNTPSAQSFLGSYRVPEAVWAKGLQLSVEGLLTHASDSQVSPTAWHYYCWFLTYSMPFINHLPTPNIAFSSCLHSILKSSLPHSSMYPQVRPIVGNKSIEAIEKAVFKPAALPFPALSTEDIGRLSQTELESHLTQVTCSSAQKR